MITSRHAVRTWVRAVADIDEDLMERRRQLRRATRPDVIVIVQDAIDELLDERFAATRS